VTRTELQEIDWDKGDKVTAQLGSLMEVPISSSLLCFV